MKKIISLCFIASAIVFSSCEEKSANTTTSQPERKRQVVTEQVINAIPQVIEEGNEQPFDKNVKKNAKIKVSTDFGDMVLRLYDETPRHRDNFLKVEILNLKMLSLVNGWVLVGLDTKYLQN